MTDEQKTWIDTATYEQLLRRWRMGSVGDEIFVGDVGAYYAQMMQAKRLAVGENEHVRISKTIGWPA